MQGSFTIASQYIFCFPVVLSVYLMFFQAVTALVLSRMMKSIPASLSKIMCCRMTSRSVLR